MNRHTDSSQPSPVSSMVARKSSCIAHVLYHSPSCRFWKAAVSSASWMSAGPWAPSPSSASIGKASSAPGALAAAADPSALPGGAGPPPLALPAASAPAGASQGPQSPAHLQPGRLARCHPLLPTCWLVADLSPPAPSKDAPRLRCQPRRRPIRGQRPPGSRCGSDARRQPPSAAITVARTALVRLVPILPAEVQADDGRCLLNTKEPTGGGASRRVQSSGAFSALSCKFAPARVALRTSPIDDGHVALVHRPRCSEFLTAPGQSRPPSRAAKPSSTLPPRRCIARSALHDTPCAINDEEDEVALRGRASGPLPREWGARSC